MKKTEKAILENELELTNINVELEGLSDIMFDRFVDHSKESRPPDQKLYLIDENKATLPSANIIAFFFNENPPAGCAKTFEGRKGKDYCRIGQSHVFFDPLHIPLLCEGREITFSGFNNGSPFYIDPGNGGRTKGSGSNSIKQEAKPRPVLRLPWEIRFSITLLKNAVIDESKLHNWLKLGGLQIALGTYRPRFGRFRVSKFEVT